MFIFTIKLPRRRLALGTAAGALLFCALLCAALIPPSARQAASVGQSSPSGAARSDQASALPSPKGIRDNEDRIAYLQGFGWQVVPQPASTEELLIPEEMDESYASYLDLQSSQGFDLAKYAGKRVKRYTYEITNYPTGETGVLVNLLVYKRTVVGGEVLSPRLDGFLHGLAMP